MSPKARFAILFVLAALWTGFCGAGSVYACPGCKEAVLDGPEETERKLSTAKGYMISILFMLAVPAGLVGTVAYSVMKNIRRKSVDTPGLSR